MATSPLKTDTTVRNAGEAETPLFAEPPILPPDRLPAGQGPEIASAGGSAIAEVIARAAADPNTDVDKFERLLALQERMQGAQAKRAYIAALIRMKPLLPVIERNGAITIREKGTDKIIQSTPYALWEDIDEAITPILTAHGFVLTFRSGVAADGKITVTGILNHQEGHSDETTIALVSDTTGSKNNVQGVGSALSYGKRYSATLLLNIRTKGQDDDGKAGGTSTISDEDVEKIFDLIKSTKADTAKFCKTFGIEAVLDLPKAEFGRAMEMLNTKAKKIAAEAKS